MITKRIQFLLLFLSSLLFSNLLGSTTQWPHAHGMNTEQLENFLATAKITSMETTEYGITRPQKVTLEKNNKSINAIFKTYSGIRKGKRRIGDINNADRFEYDIAAYRLDQLLDLNMIPVTVEREVNGKKGAMAFWVENTIVYHNIISNQPKALNVCPFKKQNAIMFAFDILIFNDDRNMGNILYSIDNCLLWMIDHSRSFRIINRISRNLPDHEIRFSKHFADKLRQLNHSLLKEKMGKLLTKTQIKYILKRRDLMLKKWNKNGQPDFLEG